MRSRRLRAAATTIGVTATLLSAACYAGCEAVPDIRFVGADAADAARSDSPSGDGGTDASDAARDGADASCTGPSPSVGATCCAPVWCEGDCAPANCDECAQKARSGLCLAGEVCCGKTGNVVCKRQCP